MPLAMIVAFTVSVFQPIGVVVGHIIYGQLESHFLVPKIYSRTVNMSPLLVIVATIVGGALDGFVGIFIGIPVAGALKVVLDYVVTERVKGREASAQTMATEPTDPIGAQETLEEHGGVTESPVAEEPVPEGVPAPSFSPFERLPEAAPEVENVSGARFLTLARTRSRAHKDGQGAVRVRRRLRQVSPSVELQPEQDQAAVGQPAAADAPPPASARPEAPAPRLIG